MGNDASDFWPDIGDAPKIRTPVSILREQAAILADKTGHLLRAHVRSVARGTTFSHTFLIIVPRLDDYEYELFEIRHEISLYPVTAFMMDVKELKDETAFIEWLRKVLSSPRTAEVLRNLIAQVSR